MCFSAQASFGASLLLFGVSYASIKNLKYKDLIVIAAVPLMFAIQQAFEGLVWLSANKTLPEIFFLAKYGFMFFAFVVWPFWIPFACWHIEKDKQRKNILLGILAAGSAVSATLLIQVLSGVTVAASCHNLSYTTNLYFGPDWLALLLYSIATIAPFLISSYKNMWVFGLMTGLTLLSTMAFFWYFLISVWCFFAAIVSAFVYLLVRKR